MEFHVGDPVMHWTHGFGHVVGLEERAISDQKAFYYAISIRDLTVWVPSDEQLEYRLRAPTKKDEFKKLFTILTGASEPLPNDRQERKAWLLAKLKDGRADSLCRVLRDLATFQQSHSLSDSDQNLMRRSREALLSEWMHAFSIPTVEAEEDLRTMLAAGDSGELKSQ